MACLIQQVGRDVDTSDLGPFTGGRYGQVARATGDVQHLHTRRDTKGVDKRLSVLCRIFRNLSEVAGHPCGTHFFFELFHA